MGGGAALDPTACLCRWHPGWQRKCWTESSLQDVRDVGQRTASLDSSLPASKSSKSPTYTHAYTCTCTHKHTHTCATLRCAGTRARTHAHANTHTHTHTHTHTPHTKHKTQYGTAKHGRAAAILVEPSASISIRSAFQILASSKLLKGHTVRAAALQANRQPLSTPLSQQTPFEPNKHSTGTQSPFFFQRSLGHMGQ